jgi:hypothetical protein
MRGSTQGSRPHFRSEKEYKNASLCLCARLAKLRLAGDSHWRPRRDLNPCYRRESGSGAILQGSPEFGRIHQSPMATRLTAHFHLALARSGFHLFEPGLVTTASPAVPPQLSGVRPCALTYDALRPSTSNQPRAKRSFSTGIAVLAGTKAQASLTELRTNLASECLPDAQRLRKFCAELLPGRRDAAQAFRPLDVFLNQTTAVPRMVVSA